MSDKGDLHLTDEVYQRIADEFVAHFAKNFEVGPAMYAALLGNFVGKIQHYITTMSPMTEEEFKLTIEENRKLGIALMNTANPEVRH